MNKYLFRRTLRTFLTLWVLLTLLFVLMRLSGDPIRSVFENGTPQYIIDYYRKKWGLDRPVLQQYFEYLGNILKGDLGRSFFDGRPVLDHIGEALPNTLKLGLISFLVSSLGGLALGLWAALKQGSFIDRMIVTITVLSYSMPNYFLGIIMILVLSLGFRWLPTGGMGDWKNYIMPVITLATPAAAYIARFARSALLDVLRQPYLRTANAKGVKWFRRISWHALPNAAIPIVTILGLQLGWIIGGAAVVEIVFSWPGIGRMLVTAVGKRDFEMVQGVVLIIGLSVTLTNFLVDLLYALLDPRIKYSKESSS